MKRIYIVALFTLFAVSLFAQTVITNKHFPNVGDVLRTTVDENYRSFDVTLKGSKLNWDFSMLEPSVVLEERFVEPSQGALADSFPNANLLKIDNAQTATYLSVSDDNIIELGITGLDPAFGLVSVNSKVDGQAYYRRSPINYNDTFSSKYSYQAEIPVDVLPDTIKSFFNGIVSDIRIKISFNKQSEIDAWGSVILPDETYNDVLRINQSLHRTTDVELKLFGLTWTNLSDLSGQFSVPDFLRELIKPVSQTNYIFVSNDAKEDLVNVTVDSLGNVLNTRFKVSKTTFTSDEALNTAYVSVYPNPTYGEVTFTFNKMPADNYTVELYDILGRKVWSKVSKYGQASISENLSGIRRGTYLYRVYNSKGKKLFTKRLMIIRP